MAKPFLTSAVIEKSLKEHSVESVWNRLKILCETNGIANDHIGWCGNHFAESFKEKWNIHYIMTDLDKDKKPTKRIMFWKNEIRVETDKINYES